MFIGAITWSQLDPHMLAVMATWHYSDPGSPLSLTRAPMGIIDSDEAGRLAEAAPQPKHRHAITALSRSLSLPLSFSLSLLSPLSSAFSSLLSHLPLSSLICLSPLSSAFFFS